MRRFPVIADLAALAGFTVLTAAFTWPVPLKFFTHLAGDWGDAWQFLFNIWWVKHVLAQGGDLFQTPYMYHPYGANLLLHTLSLFNSFPAAILSFFTDYIQSYNVVLLLQYPLAGYGAFKLINHLTFDRLASFVGACFFAFSPFHACHGVCHLQLCAIGLIPLAVLYLLKTLEEPGIKNPALSALFVVLAAESSWYFLVYLAVFFSLFAAVWLFRAKVGRFATVKRLAMILILAAVTLGPRVVAMVHARATIQTVKGHSPWYWSADVENLFVPGQRSAWRGFFKDVSKDWTGNREENSAYLGYVLLLLAGLGIAKGKWRHEAYKYVFTAGFVVFLLYCLGPYLHVGGRVFRNVPLPMALADLVPFGFGTAPVRASLAVNLCLVVLGGAGLAWVRKRLERRRIARSMAIAGFFIAGMVEFWPALHPVTRMPVPDFFFDMAKDKGDYAVLDMRSYQEQVYGIVRHERPLVNGHIARDPVLPRKKLYAIPVIRAMMRRPKRFEPSRLPGGREKALADLKALDVRYIVRRAGHGTGVEEALDMKLAYQGKGVKIFVVPR